MANADEGVDVESANQEQPAAAASFWQPFTHRVFAAIWIAAFFSDMGTWIQNTGAGWLISKLTTSPGIISLMVTATSLPAFLLGLPAGALADIFNRRKIFLFTQLWMFGFAAALAVLTYLNLITPWMLLAASFLIAIGPALNETVWQSVVPTLVPPENLAAAITLNGVSINLARAIGPAIGGLLLAEASPFFVFALNAVCFLATFVIVFFWKGTTTSTTLQSERFIGAIRSGVQYVWYARQLRPVLLRTLVFAFGGSAVWGMLPYVIIHKLNLDAGVYGTALFFIGAGALSAAALLPAINRRLSNNAKLGICILVIAATCLALLFITNLAVLYGFLFLTGLAWLGAMSGFNVAIQSNIPAWVQARAISIYLLIFQGGMAGGGLLWGFAANHWGIAYALVGAAAVMGASLILAVPYPMPATAAVDWTPYAALPAAVLQLQVGPREGPVLVLIDYQVTKANIRLFTSAMADMRLLRMRNGARQVGLFQDVSQPEVVTEIVLLESWSDYLIQRERYTTEDKEVENAVLALHSGAAPPVVRQLVAQVPLTTT